MDRKKIIANVMKKLALNEKEKNHLDVMNKCERNRRAVPAVSEQKI